MWSDILWPNVILLNVTYYILIWSFLGHCHLAETGLLQLVWLFFVFGFHFRNATPLLFCPPSLDKQKLKDLETSRDKQDKLDKQDTQDDQPLLHSIKHHLNFIPDSSLAESCDNLFSPALKSTIKKYRIWPDFSQNTAVFKKGIIFKLWGGPVFLWDIGESFFIFFVEGLKKSFFDK